MEVRTEPGILSAKDSFTVTVPKSPTSSPSTTVQNMRMAFSGDGMAVYRPVSGNSGPALFQEGGGEFPVVQGLTMNTGDAVKRKRGRPRKYASDGRMPLGLLSAPASSSQAAVEPLGDSTGFTLSYASAAGTPALQNSSSFQVKLMKKGKGRQLGLSKKFQMDAIGSGGIGFTPHVITVKAGEDVSAKIMTFSHHGPRAVCVLSANGAISNVTLRQAATSGGTVTYEGRFEILSLSGSFLLSESAGHRRRTGGLSVSLAGPDGRVMGGGVAGLLTAASPVQVVVGSFISDGGRKAPQVISPIEVASAPAEVATGRSPVPLSPHSVGTPSECSGGGGLDSPLNLGPNENNNNGTANQQGLPNISWM